MNIPEFEFMVEQLKNKLGEQYLTADDIIREYKRRVIKAAYELQKRSTEGFYGNYIEYTPPGPDAVQCQAVNPATTAGCSTTRICAEYTPPADGWDDQGNYYNYGGTDPGPETPTDKV